MLYIRATGNISPQPTFGHMPFPQPTVAYTGNRLACREPDYRQLIDPKLIRRMSRIIRMGVAAGLECLQEAGVTEPAAIITGTAYGCMEDTGLFLTRMIEQQEELLTPTAFIQSTHNTIGAQIGLLLNCHGYNNAFVHRAFSFESALLDAMLMVEGGEASSALVGAIDEITDYSHAILNRLGLYRQNEVVNLSLFDSPAKGTVGGEGAAFFLLTQAEDPANYAELVSVETFFEVNRGPDARQWLLHFLSANPGIDLVLEGRNGDATMDAGFAEMKAGAYPEIPATPFKHLCGDYPTASAFACWLAAQMLRTGEIPSFLPLSAKPAGTVKTILVYNQFPGGHHSLILLSAC